jgi:enoyl-CoA hydratase/carnithine racemase
VSGGGAAAQPAGRVAVDRPHPGVLTLTLNHPPVNALSRAMLSELLAAVTAALSDPAVRVIVLTGAGGMFCAGADVREFPALAAAGEAEAMGRDGQAFVAAVWEADKPVLAAVQGAARGGGFELALAAGVRLAAALATFALPEVTLGLMPDWGGTQLLPRLIGRGPALRALLTGEALDAETARRLGLLSEVTAPEDLMPRALALAARLAEGAPLAQAAILRAVRQGEMLPLREALAVEQRNFMRVAASRDAGRGILARLTRTTARFEGD